MYQRSVLSHLEYFAVEFLIALNEVCFCLYINWLILNIVSIIPASLYFIFVSNEWKYFYSAAIITSIVSFPFIFWIPESPKYLYETKQHDELRLVIRRIADTNSTEMDNNYEFEKNISVLRSDNETPNDQIELHSNSVSTVSYLKDTTILVNLIAL